MIDLTDDIRLANNAKKRAYEIAIKIMRFLSVAIFIILFFFAMWFIPCC